MKKKIKEYLTLTVQSTGEETEEMLNERAEEGWKLICSYVRGTWLIMERDKEIQVCKECSKHTQKTGREE